ncbi:metal ABC transporter ATP-binding protein [Nesterenkonia flava]|uniref:Metal ABC transporter ATP-binding protein n=1 Tax=Nesterenkonia flava TaxID=469799 RepID=A0ABU1FTT7_9MICC|nr:metal ABC transporter ATP-binding protein [Nesterenkonia flava]MDR5711652.1 metal ABC transporter ATP-binding protein [Nesterenkonia flava]
MSTHPSRHLHADDDAVVVKSVTAGYPGVTALEDVSLSLRPGAVTALLGANGSGKSTLFSVLLGLLKPHRGTVRLYGSAPARARRRNLVSFVPQHEHIDATFPITVEQVVLTGRYGGMGLTRRARPADRQAVDEALERVGLSDFRRRSIGELSGGQRKRAFTARAIAQGAPLMLLDEPFAGVDRGSEELITRLLRELAASGTTVLISTHHLEGVADMADDVVLLHRRILASGPAPQVLTPQRLSEAFGSVFTASAHEGNS